MPDVENVVILTVNIGWYSTIDAITASASAQTTGQREGQHQQNNRSCSKQLHEH